MCRVKYPYYEPAPAKAPQKQNHMHATADTATDFFYLTDNMQQTKPERKQSNFSENLTNFAILQYCARVRSAIL